MHHLTAVNHRSAWTANGLKDNASSWTYELSGADVDELDQALQQVKARSLTVPKFGAADFRIPNLLAKLHAFKQELSGGLGLLYIRGLPIENYSKDEASAIFWGIGAHIGKPWEQNMRGHVLGDVIDEGRNVEDTSARGYQTSAALGFHTDGADVVGLLCLKQAPVGGENQIISAVSIFNKMAANHPQALQHLLDTEFCIDWRDEQGPGAVPFHQGTLFSTRADEVLCFALVPYIFSAQRHADAARLTDADREALGVFEAMTGDAELAFHFKQSAGDMFFLNNHYHLHARSSYQDSTDPTQRRHLRRLWLECDDWAGRRSRIMENVLINARAYWQKPHSTVQMWD